MSQPSGPYVMQLHLQLSCVCHLPPSHPNCHCGISSCWLAIGPLAIFRLELILGNHSNHATQTISRIALQIANKLQQLIKLELREATVGQCHCWCHLEILHYLNPQAIRQWQCGMCLGPMSCQLSSHVGCVTVIATIKLNLSKSSVCRFV